MSHYTQKSSGPQTWMWELICKILEENVREHLPHYKIGKYLGTETITTKKINRDFIKIKKKTTSHSKIFLRKCKSQSQIEEYIHNTCIWLSPKTQSELLKIEFKRINSDTHFTKGIGLTNKHTKRSPTPLFFGIM